MFVTPWTKNLNIYLSLCLHICVGGYAMCVDAYIGQRRADTKSPEARDRGGCEPFSVVLRTKLRCYGREACTLNQ